ncbi:MAG: hypothetical protein HY242_01645 [Afipia sp.]|nr:hypothetical protein [Afipia sp.]
MAVAKQRPTIDLGAGAAALEQDLPRVLNVLGATSIEELGWRRHNRLTLLVPMSGTFQDKTTDYLLRLGFQAYREWPPSARFVNPETLDYRGAEDARFVPQLTSDACRTHIQYPDPHNNGTMVQLICCSATFEFYDVLHEVDSKFLWRNTDTFLLTINAIRKAFVSSYQGPFA